MFKGRFISSALMLSSALAFVPEQCGAFTVDPSEYFAYYKIPDRARGRVRTSSPYILLSKKPCQGIGFNEDVHAKHGVSYWPGMEETRTECWAEIERYNEIHVCPVDTKSKKIGSACVDIPKSRFIDTKYLSQQANW